MLHAQHADSMLAPVRKERDQLFVNMLVATWVILATFTVLYTVMNVPKGWAIIAFGAFVLSPINVALVKRGHPLAARDFFILCSTFYIYSTSLVMGHEIRSEFYYMAALLTPLLIYEPHQTVRLSLGFALPLLSWMVSRIFGSGFVAADILTARQIEFIQTINFLGAFGISVLFLMLFRRSNARLIEIMNSQARDKFHRLKQISEKQDHILDAAELGAWEFDEETGIYTVDRRWTSMLGLERDRHRITSFELETLIHADDRAHVAELKAAYREGRRNSYEAIFRALNPDGTWIWILDRGRIVQRELTPKHREPTHQWAGTFLQINELKSKEVLGQKMQKMAKIGAWELDLKNDRLMWTEQVYRILGLTTATHPSLDTWTAQVKESDAIRFRRFIDGCKTGVSFREQFALESGSAELRWIEVMGQPIENALGQTAAIQGTLQDVTDQKRATEALAATQGELTQTMSALSGTALISTTDIHGNIIEANPAFCRVSGYSESELIGKNHRVVASGAHPKAFFQGMWNTLLSGRPWTGVIQNRTKLGQPYFVKAIMTPLRDASGAIVKLRSIRFDITQQILAQRQLEEAQALSRIGSWTFSPAIGTFECSLEMLQHLGKSEGNSLATLSEVLGHLDAADRAVWDERWNLALATRGSFQIKCRWDGDRWMEWNGHAASTSDSSPILMQGTCQDITERVRAEEQLQSERSKSVHQAKLASLGEIAAGIAHEINNPLAVAVGHLGLIRKDSSHAPKIAERIATIDKSMFRIEKIVRNLKRLSRFEAAPEHTPQSLSNIIADAVIIAEWMARKHDCKILVDAPTGGQVLGHALELEQVIINLVHNAIDATKHLPDRWVKISLHETPQNILLRVTDSGGGISPEIEAKLFQPFFTTKAPGEGTGLGLSIVKTILDEHHATINLHRPSPNTCFEIAIPKWQPEAKKDVGKKHVA